MKWLGLSARHAWILICVFAFVIPRSPGLAQEGPETDALVDYEEQKLGITFQMPGDWVARSNERGLVAGTNDDLDRIEDGQLPLGLILSIMIGNYNQLGLENVDQLSEKINDLIPPATTATPSEEVTYGNSSGVEVQFTAEDSNLVTRIAILLASDGRVAIVRGMAPQPIWNTGGSTLLTEIMQSIRFTLPANITAPLADVPDSDGGVLWHYQIGQGRDQRPIALGGLTLDRSGTLYIAAGSRGMLVLNSEAGAYVDFLGPIFRDDNLADVAISPDERLYFANATTNAGRRIMVVDRAGNLLESWGEAGEDAGQFAEGMPHTIAVSPAGDVWVASEGHRVPPENRLYRFDGDGNFLEMFDLATIQPNLKDVYLDFNLSADRLYVVGKTGGFNALTWRGEAIATGVGEEILTEAGPTAVSITSSGDLVIATENEGFILMNTAGVILDRFGFAYDETRGGAFLPGEYHRPDGIVAMSPERAYFAETHPETGFAQVQAITFSGDGNLAIAQRTPAVSDVQANTQALSEGGEIAYDGTVRGVLNNRSDSHLYTFTAQAGDSVVITLQRAGNDQSLDPLLYLLDSANNLLAENDDVGDSGELHPTDARIRFTFSQSGTYTIRATRFGGQGEYILSLTTD
ncbi:MAG: hypothetical protein GYB66_16335 [Chloroflexi bacterium]|nr:hypothetical protein [Chloroflexota bacterium]